MNVLHESKDFFGETEQTKELAIDMGALCQELGIGNGSVWRSRWGWILQASFTGQVVYLANNSSSLYDLQLSYLLSPCPV